MMKVNIFALIAAGCLMTLMTGCVGTVDGRSKAGVPWVKDTIESRYERPVEQIFAAAKEVLKFNGTLYGENTITKTLEAKINTTTVFIRVDEVDPKVSRVLVQARASGGSGDIATASEIDKQIALRLK
jgi:hypothetical protein